METRTTMKRRFVRGLLAAIAVCGLLSSTRAAQAQEIQLTGPLKGAQATRHLRLYREGRLDIAPAVSFTLLDEYRRTILVGARLEYNITDWFSIGAWGAYGAVSLTTDLTDKIDSLPAPRDALTANNVNHNGMDPNHFGSAPFADQTSKIQWVGVPQITFTPFRGKLAIFNKIFVDADFYVAGGVGFVGLQKRADCGAPASSGSGNNTIACSDPKSFALDTTVKVSPTFGVGFTFYPGGFWSLGVEYRALPFAWNRAGFDSRGSGPGGNFPDGQVNSNDETFQFNQLVTVSIGIYFPTKPKLSE
jgi:outer membrane beta-barrel protein